MTYASDGRLTGWTLGSGAANTRTFDFAGQLTALESPPRLDRTYSRDGVGNITDIYDVARRSTFGYDSLNRLLTSGRTLVYDPAQRIAKIVQGLTTVAEYEYDAKMRRTSKLVSGSTTLFAHDRASQIIAELTPDCTSLCDAGHTFQTLNEYIYLGSERLALIRNEAPGAPSGSASYFYSNDHLGTPFGLASASGNAVWETERDPWGNRFAESTSLTGFVRPFDMPGQYRDAESGLSYNWHRFYDRETGRYQSVGPLDSDLGAWSQYHYVYARPLSWDDFDGISACCCSRCGSDAEHGHHGRVCVVGCTGLVQTRPAPTVNARRSPVLHRHVCDVRG